MFWDAFTIISTGALVAITCGLLGCFLVLRKMALVGDAISHAVLPGIVIAYLISGTRTSFPMLIGAAAFGMLTTWLIELFHRKARLQEDAAIGLSFTMLFALGVILVTAFTGQVDLDQECVLYGEIAFVPLDLWLLPSGMSLGPAPLWTMGFTLLLVLGLVVFGYRGLYLTTFDPQFAATIGISTVLWHYLLMGAVSLTTVVAFENVGAILVVAFLIAPAATAWLLTHRLKTMLWLSAGVGILSAAGGYWVAVLINGSIAGSMTTVAGLLFVLAFLFSPSQGLLTRKRQEVKEPKVGKVQSVVESL